MLQMEQIKKIRPEKKKGVFHEPEEKVFIKPSARGENNRRAGININHTMIGVTEPKPRARNKELNLDDEIIFNTDNDDGRQVTSPGASNKQSEKFSEPSIMSGKSVNRNRK